MAWRALARARGGHILRDDADEIHVWIIEDGAAHTDDGQYAGAISRDHAVINSQLVRTGEHLEFGNLPTPTLILTVDQARALAKALHPIAETPRADDAINRW